MWRTVFLLGAANLKSLKGCQETPLPGLIRACPRTSMEVHMCAKFSRRAPVSRTQSERDVRIVVIRCLVAFCLVATLSIAMSSLTTGKCSPGLTKCARMLSRISFDTKAGPSFQFEMTKKAAVTEISSTPFRVQGRKCGPRKAVIKQLSKQFSEHRKARGLISSEVLMELFASKNGTWTVILSNAQGVSCVLTAGDFWQPTPELVGPEA